MGIEHRQTVKNYKIITRQIESSQVAGHMVSYGLPLAMSYQDVFVALADPTRRGVFEALRGQAKTVGELARDQPVSRPAVSQHLKVLESANLVSVTPKGKRRYYSIKRDGLDGLRQYLESFWSDTLSAYAAEIERRVGTQAVPKRKKYA